MTGTDGLHTYAALKESPGPAPNLTLHLMLVRLKLQRHQYKQREIGPNIAIMAGLMSRLKPSADTFAMLLSAAALAVWPVRFNTHSNRRSKLRLPNDLRKGFRPRDMKAKFVLVDKN